MDNHLNTPVLRAAALILLLAAVFCAQPCLAQSSPDRSADGGGAASFLLPPALPQGGGTQSPNPPSSGGIGDRFRTVERNAPEREDQILINLGNKHVDGIFGGMGEGSGVGGGIRLTTADSLPGVEFAVSAIGTFKGYRQFQGDMIVGHLGNEGTHFDASFRYRRRTKDNFFGLGPKVGPVDFPTFDPGTGVVLLPFQSEAFETNFDVEERRTSASLYHDFTDRLQAGVYVAYRSTSSYTGADDADTPIGTFFSPVGLNFCSFFPGDTPMCFSRVALPGLFSGSKILSEGAYVELDVRNNEEGRITGGYLYARVANHDGKGRIDANPRDFLPPLPFFGPPGSFPFTITFPDRDFNDFGWIQFTADLRGYLPLGTDRTTLALRYYTDLNSKKGNSTIPFYYLPTAGGRTTLRGFDTFRFRGENAVVFNGELRQTVMDFSDDFKYGKGFDVIVFGDLGQVWGLDIPGDFGRNLPGDSFDTDNYEADFGFGLQYRYTKEFVIRLDYGHSNEGNKVWFSFNRVF